MARKPNAQCNKCGKTAWRPPSKYGTEYRCQPCRRDEPQPTKPTARRYEACQGCDQAIESPRNGQRFCSYTCYTLTLRRPEARTCAICGEGFLWRRRAKTAGLCCSRQCGQELRRRQQREAAAQAKPGPHTRVTIRPCVSCAEWLVIQGVSPRKRCGSCTAQVARDKAREYYAKKKRKEPAVRIAECEWCAGEYPQTNHQQKYCTPRCGKTARGARSDRVRAAYHGVEYQPINRHRIYTRDDWTCGICGDRIDPGAKWPDLMRLTLTLATLRQARLSATESSITAS